MTRYKSYYWILVARTVFLATTTANAQDAQPKVKNSKAAKAAKTSSLPPVPPPDFTLEPKAMEILKAACSRLAAAKSMTFTAVVSMRVPVAWARHWCTRRSPRSPYSGRINCG